LVVECPEGLDWNAENECNGDRFVVKTDSFRRPPAEPVAFKAAARRCI
jgi:hypothetical protein